MFSLQKNQKHYENYVIFRKFQCQNVIKISILYDCLFFFFFLYHTNRINFVKNRKYILSIIKLQF